MVSDLMEKMRSPVWTIVNIIVSGLLLPLVLFAGVQLWSLNTKVAVLEAEIKAIDMSDRYKGRDAERDFAARDDRCRIADRRRRAASSSGFSKLLPAKLLGPLTPRASKTVGTRSTWLTRL